MAVTEVSVHIRSLHVLSCASIILIERKISLE